eukprot:TRINITY_DN24344_c0_g1_i3.p1 TRINITY_DN24344_c0_g1~~TRINITY_DN24344_c0_g1_i3.p1  ORF type:complete len:1739 (+),score=304.31 TRINITY_DN24344_c0_g1_i3:62-5278(+)
MVTGGCALRLVTIVPVLLVRAVRLVDEAANEYTAAGPPCGNGGQNTELSLPAAEPMQTPVADGPNMESHHEESAEPTPASATAQGRDGADHAHERDNLAGEFSDADTRASWHSIGGGHSSGGGGGGHRHGHHRRSTPIPPHHPILGWHPGHGDRWGERHTWRGSLAEEKGSRQRQPPSLEDQGDDSETDPRAPSPAPCTTTAACGGPSPGTTPELPPSPLPPPDRTVSTTPSPDTTPPLTVVVDCTGHWREWSHCTTTCGEGVQMREFTVVQPGQPGGKPCPLREERPCKPTVPCPVDCKGQWGRWSKCSKSCDGGVKVRTFVVTRPALSGGRPCEGDMEERLCKEQDCPVDCSGRWMEWSKCSKTCDGGQQVKKFKVERPPEAGGKACPASPKLQLCSQGPCPVDCVGSWGNWSQCTTSCGTGTTSRKFIVTTPAANGGVQCPKKQRDSCNPTVPCPVNCQGNWDEWTTCSATCDGGQQSRTFRVAMPGKYGGKKCPTSQTRECNTDKCQIFFTTTITTTTTTTTEETVDCQGEWSKWTTCSATCGGGTQASVFKILVPPKNGGKPCPSSKRSRQCKTQRCPITTTTRTTTGTRNSVDCQGEWTEWENCSATCDGGVQSSSFKVSVLPKHGGEPCPDEDEKTRECNTQQCPTTTTTTTPKPVDCTGHYNQWTKCSATCGKGTQQRTFVIDQKAENGGKPCEEKTETRLCNVQECPVDCKGRWGQWTECSAPCGAGTQLRTFVVEIEGNNGGEPCPDAEEDRPCNTQICSVDCEGHWTPFSECSATCGLGRHSSSYVITRYPEGGGKPCPAGKREKECKMRECPVDCEGTWGPWSTCPTTCGPGQQLRDFQVSIQAQFGGDECPTREDRECNLEVHCPVNCEGKWDEWTECSATCGGGVQSRIFKVGKPAEYGGKQCPTHEQRRCSDQSCPTTTITTTTVTTTTTTTPGDPFTYLNCSKEVLTNWERVGSSPLPSPDGCLRNVAHVVSREAASVVKFKVTKLGAEMKISLVVARKQQTKQSTPDAACDDRKCSSWDGAHGTDCCADPKGHGERQTCSGGYIVNDTGVNCWNDFTTYQCCPPAAYDCDDAKCTSWDGKHGTDCCADPTGRQEKQTCADGYEPKNTNEKCWQELTWYKCCKKKPPVKPRFEMPSILPGGAEFHLQVAPDGTISDTAGGSYGRAAVGDWLQLQYKDWKVFWIKNGKNFHETVYEIPDGADLFAYAKGSNRAEMCRLAYHGCRDTEGHERECFVSGDPHIRQFDGHYYDPFYAPGHWWLVRTELDAFSVQAVYEACGTDKGNRQGLGGDMTVHRQGMPRTCLTAVGFGGRLLRTKDKNGNDVDNKLVIKPACSWSWKHQRCRDGSNSGNSPQVLWNDKRITKLDEIDDIVTVRHEANHRLDREFHLDGNFKGSLHIALPADVVAKISFGLPLGHASGDRDTISLLALTMREDAFAFPQCGHCGNNNGKKEEKSWYNQEGFLNGGKNVPDICEPAVKCKDRLIGQTDISFEHAGQKSARSDCKENPSPVKISLDKCQTELLEAARAQCTEAFSKTRIDDESLQHEEFKNCLIDECLLPGFAEEEAKEAQTVADEAKEPRMGDDFESVSVTSEYERATQMEGWDVIKGTIYVIASGNAAWGETTAADGQYFLALQMRGSFVAMSRAMVPGGSYRLVYNAARRAGYGDDASFGISIGGERLEDFVPQDTQFKKRALSFDAPKESVEIKFENVSPAGCEFRVLHPR